jgi:hypothetical protein
MATLLERLTADGPKRILSLDGGGIRGMLSLALLERIEELLQSQQPKSKQENFVLADYFDLIAGTSTGSIIAAGLALGWKVQRLLNLYKTLSTDVFIPRARLPWQKYSKAKYKDEPLRILLQKEFGTTTKLGDVDKTGLMIMTKKLDTEHIWAFHNNPKGKFYNKKANKYPGNKNYHLAEVVRASTAAPMYFDPERIDLNHEEGTKGVFVDGGVTPFNNPSLAALMVATIKGFGFNWPLGKDKLLLVSIGTGWKKNVHRWTKSEATSHTKLALPAFASLQNDCDYLGQAILQWMSDSPTAVPVHGEVGDLKDEYIAGGPLLSYVRYNTEIDSDDLAKMDEPKNIQSLYEKGKRTRHRILESHFPTDFPGNSITLHSGPTRSRF